MSVIKDPAIGRRASKKYYQKNKEKCKRQTRNARLKAYYGITLERYEAMLFAQKECCAMCGKHRSAFKYTLAVDHCHKTGKVRSLLCAPCNTSLGHYENNKLKFEEYLSCQS